MVSRCRVSSSRRKARSAYYNAPSGTKYRMMAATLSKELREKYGIKSLPVRRDDLITIVRGTFKDTSGKVTNVYRKRWCLYVEKATKTRKNGATVRVPINPSNCVIT